MKKYQIRFCDSKGCGFFEYILVKHGGDVMKITAEKATEVNDKRKLQHTEQSQWNIFKALHPYKSKRVVHVWEWDLENKQPKKGGHRFKLKLAYIQATYTDGSKSRKEWYEPVIETKKVTNAR